MPCIPSAVDEPRRSSSYGSHQTKQQTATPANAEDLPPPPLPMDTRDTWKEWDENIQACSSLAWRPPDPPPPSLFLLSLFLAFFFRLLLRYFLFFFLLLEFYLDEKTYTTYVAFFEIGGDGVWIYVCFSFRTGLRMRQERQILRIQEEVVWVCVCVCVRVCGRGFCGRKGENTERRGTNEKPFTNT